MKGIFAVILLLVCLCTIASAEVFPQQPQPPRPSLDAGYVSQNPSPNYPWGPDQAYTDFNLYAQGVSVFDFTPTWAHLSHGNSLTNQIEIHGCGFRAHTDVVCVFEWKTTSVTAWIVDDNTIVCVLPERTLEELPTLPQYQRLDLVFDGEFYQAHANANDWPNGLFNYIYVGQFRWGPEISCTNPINPTAGYTDGRETLTIYGEGFLDPVLNISNSNVNLTVYFDDEPVSATVTSDSTITCSPPSVDNLYENRIVKVVWRSSTDEEVFLVSNTLYFYGPEFFDLSPSCVNYDGSTPMVISGARFDDPLIQRSSGNYVDSRFSSTSPPGAPSSSSVNNQVRLDVELMGTTIDWDSAYFRSNNLTDSNPAVSVLEAIGTVSDANTISFNPPNFMAGVSTATANSFIIERQKLSTHDAKVQNVRFNTNYGLAAYPDFGQTFRYGSYVTDVEDRWFGGQSNWCFNGCFSTLDQNYLQTNGTIFLNGAGKDLGDGDDQCIGRKDVSATQFCCETERYDNDCDDDNFILATNISVSTVYSTGVFTYPAASGLMTAHVGPQVNEPESYRTTVSSGSIVITGTYLGYSNYGTISSWLDILVTSSTLHNCATNLELLTESTNTSFSNRNSSQIWINPTSDTSLTVNFGVSCFGETLTITGLDFVDAVSTTDCQVTVDLETAFGPTCSIDEDDIYVLLHNPTLNIQLEYGGAYTPLLLLCDADKPGNIGNFAAVPTDPVTGEVRNRCYLGIEDTFNPTSPSSPVTGYVGGTEVVRTVNQQTTSPLPRSLTYNAGSFVSSFDYNRGRRVWGQKFDATLVFNTLQDQIYYQDSSFVAGLWSDFDFYFNTTTLTNAICVDASGFADRGITGSNSNSALVANGPCYSLASIQCGTFRFGPVTDSISPCQGPSGTQDNFQQTAVTIDGIHINDNWPTAQGSDSGSHLVSFGTLFGTPASTGSSTINFNTVWGANSNAQFQYSASVFFDTCNITWSDKLIVHWGPVLDSMAPAFPEDQTPDDDIWGFFPYNPNAMGNLQGFDFSASSFNFVTLSGYGFFYGKNYAQLTSSSDTSSARVTVASGIRVTVDGVPAAIAAASLASVSTQYGSLKVNIPPRPWGTSAKVCIAWDQENCATNTYGEDYFGEDINEDVWAYYEDLPNGAPPPSGSNVRAWWQNEIQSVNAPHGPLCYENQLHYDLKIVGDNTNSKTSGTTDGSAVAIVGGSWVCYGCVNIQLYPEVSSSYSLYAYFGGFPSTTSIPAGSLVATLPAGWNVPTYKAEFNTDVPISFHLTTSDPTLNNCTYNEWETYRVYTDITHHYGPICTGAAGQYFLNGRLSEGTFPLDAPVNEDWLTSLGGSNFQDCWTDGCATNDRNAATPALSICSRVPRVLNLEYPYSASSALSNYGVSTCLHREVQVRVNIDGTDFVLDTASANGTGTRPISLGYDTLGQWDIPGTTSIWFNSDISARKSNTDSLINIWGAYASPTQCRTVKYGLYFPDAVVSNGNNFVECTGSSFFGPKATSVASAATGLVVTYTDGAVTRIYGWDNVTGYYTARGTPVSDHQDYLLTVSGTLFNDPAVGAFDLSFDTTSAPRSFSGNFNQFNSATKITVVVPSYQTSFFRQHLPLSYQFFSTSLTALSGCADDLPATFHYGPEILYSSTDDCSASHCGDDSNDDPVDDVTIYVRGSQCCGYFDITPALSQAETHVCLMGYNTNTAVNSPWFTHELWFPSAVSYTSSQFDTITCNAPNPLSTSAAARFLPNQRLVNFGILWGNANGTTSDDQVCGSAGQICNFTSGSAIGIAAARTGGPAASAVGSVNNNPGPFYWADTYAAEVDSTSMDMCFRTKIVYDEQSVRYSGLTRALNGTDFAGFVGYDVSCAEDFSTFSCQFSGSPASDTFDLDEIDISVLCPLPQFKKTCGSDSDTVIVTFNISTGSTYSPYIQSAFTIPTGLTNGRPDKLSESVTRESGTVHYGPVLIGGPVPPSTSEYLTAYDTTDGVSRFIGQPAFFDPDQLGQRSKPYGDFDLTTPSGYNWGFKSFDAPPNVISLTVQNAADWYVHPSDQNKGLSRPWGSEQYLCVFSSDLSATPVWKRRSENCVDAAICNQVSISTLTPESGNIYQQMTPDLVPQQLISPPLGIQSTTFVSALSAFDSSVSSDHSNIFCQVPVNNWGQEGFVGVLLDPHIDLTLTQHIAPSHIAFARPYTALSDAQVPNATGDYFREGVGYWHFTPYITDLSKDWAAPNSLLESVTVYGGDFCSYGRVICTFTSRNASSETFEAVQGDILSDSMVLCQLPPYEVPQDVSLSLTFCAGQTFYSSITNNVTDGGCACAFGCDDAPNTVGPIDFQFTGVLAFAPSTGPVQGYTNITFSGVGFDNYWNLTCKFGDSAEVPVTVIDESRIQCITPPSANLLPGTVELHVIGYYAQDPDSAPETPFLYAQDLGCTSFTYGLPAVSSISPASLEYSDDFSDVQLTINGQYFNGGVPTDGNLGSYYLLWQHAQDPNTELATNPTPADFVISYTTYCVRDLLVDVTNPSAYTYQLICDVPDVENAQWYPLRVVFSDLPTIQDTLYLISGQIADITGFDTDVHRRLKDVDWCDGCKNEKARTNRWKTLPQEPVIRDIFGGWVYLEADNAIGYIEPSETSKTPGSIVCRFEPVTGNTFSHRTYFLSGYSNGTYIICEAPARPEVTLYLHEYYNNLTTNKNTRQNSRPNYMNAPLAVSLDSGFTWSDSIDIPYKRVSSAGVVGLSFLMSFVFFFSYYFF